MSKFAWGSGGLQPVSPCETCTHKHVSATCDAFPAGIPAEILTGANQHRQPYPKDNGIRYKASELPKRKA